MTKVQRVKRGADGTTEVWEPHRYPGGFYIVAPRDVGPDKADLERHHAKHQRRINSWEELVVLARSGKWHIRMSCGSSHANLIRPESYQVTDGPGRPRRLAVKVPTTAKL